MVNVFEDTEKSSAEKLQGLDMYALRKRVA